MAALLSLFSFRGTATTLQAVTSVMIYVITLVALRLVDQLAPADARWLYPSLGLATVAMLTSAARRLHHAGRTGRWAILTVIPLAGIVAGVIIAFLPQRRAHLNPHNGARSFGYLGIAAILLWSIWRLWWAPFWIPSESMKPTLLVGDFVIAGQGGAKDVARGDVVVLRLGGGYVVKRVIGLPGDTIALTGGLVVLNGAPLLQFPMGHFDEVMGPQGPDAVRPRCANGVVGDGAICSKTLLREAGPDGRDHLILNIEDDGFGDTFAATTVPANALFLLGDNRDNSFDSRYDRRVKGLGMVPFQDVVGVADRVLFSGGGTGLWQIWTWVWTRTLKAIV